MDDTETFPIPEKSICGNYDYDLIVIGGGSGGLAASKEAAKANRKLKIAVFDYVTPTPHETTWGLGGTCVNVGCIPKKLFHYAAKAKHSMEDFKALGHEGLTMKHNWDTMVENVDNYLLGMQYGYSNALYNEGIHYEHAYASFVDDHTVTYTPEGATEAKTMTADKFILAVGGRPWYPEIPGAQLALTSDDIFWWKKAVGKTLVIGASYIALECAGFLHGLGRDTSVMVRSILLRGFDQQCAQQIGELMERDGVRFLSAVPTELATDEKDGGINVTWKNNKTGQKVCERFDTVLFATGRKPQVQNLGLDKAGVATDKGGFIIVNEKEETNVPHIYGIGDAIADEKGQARPELTPVAIQVGQLLSRRLYKGATRLMDYQNVPTTVFTPAEYGAVGLSQEAAEELLGKDNVVCWVQRYGTLETALKYLDYLPEQRSHQYTGENLFAKAHADANGQKFEVYDPEDYEYEERARKYLKQPNLAKLVCEKKTGKVLGLHYVGPDAGEVLQGYALAVKAGVTKDDFDNAVGIHPTTAEEFTTLTLTMQSGEDFMKKGGC